jgi:hypothetical protein
VAAEHGLIGLDPADVRVSVRDTSQGFAGVSDAVIVAVEAGVTTAVIMKGLEAIWSHGVKELVRRRRGRGAVGADLEVTVHTVLEVDLKQAEAIDSGERLLRSRRVSTGPAPALIAYRHTGHASTG